MQTFQKSPGEGQRERKKRKTYVLEVALTPSPAYASSALPPVGMACWSQGSLARLAEKVNRQLGLLTS